jgi:hypothetical protein
VNHDLLALGGHMKRLIAAAEHLLTLSSLFSMRRCSPTAVIPQYPLVLTQCLRYTNHPDVLLSRLPLDRYMLSYLMIIDQLS